ncbi:MAG: NUDIX hydrolase [Planctomycetaceae bacterium]|nr:NUDIX hydrolase [Planctomycetaceae bacterium]
MPEDVKVLGEGKFIRLVAADGWEWAERMKVSGVIAVAAAARGKIILTEQYRRPLKANVIEVPAGLAGDSAEDAGEDVELAARRELLEETGYEARKWERMFDGPLSVGMTTEVVSFFRATGLKKVSEGGGEGFENITVHEVSLRKAAEWLAEQTAAGKLVDPKVYVGLYLLGTAAKSR